MKIGSRFKVQDSKFRDLSFRRVLFFSFFLILFPLFASLAQPLKPEQAFSFQAKAINTGLIEVRFQIAPGHYLYRDKFNFSIEPGRIKLGTPQFPTGQVKQDPTFGKTEILRGESTIRIPVTAWQSNNGPITLAITYQGCADGGFCYPPKTQKVHLTPPAPVDGRDINPDRQRGEPGNPLEQTSPFSEKDGGKGDLSRLLSQGTFLWIIMSFFGLGLLLSFTPCVLPMIPIISSIILAQGKAVTKKRAFSLSLTYVLGMSLTYTTIGVAAGVSGRLFSAILQNPWVLGAFALLFVALALSMFGFYELKIPSSLQDKLITTSNRLPGGTFLGVFFMGLLSALIVSPCVSAPLAGALLYISRTGNVFLGGSALLALSLGMGIPLLIIGTSAGVLLPKAGAWMNAVKGFFGVLLLSVALWLVSGFLPVPVQMVLWGALLIISAVTLSALDPLPLPSGGWDKFRKGIGVIALIFGAALVIGALMGGRDLLQPLSGISYQSQGSLNQKEGRAQTSGLPFERLTNLKQLDYYLKEAQGQPAMLYVSADWCTSCRELEWFTFSDPRVREKLQGMRLLKADVTRNDQEAAALLKRFELFGPPAVLFFDKRGKEIPGNRIIGFQRAGEFLLTIDKVVRN